MHVCMCTYPTAYPTNVMHARTLSAVSAQMTKASRPARSVVWLLRLMLMAAYALLRTAISPHNAASVRARIMVDCNAMLTARSGKI